MAKDDPADQELNQLLYPDGPPAVEVRNAITPLGAVGVGVAGVVAGAAVAVLWGPWGGQEAPPQVSVSSCAEQYTIVAEDLDAMVSEGLNAGRSGSPDASWVNSINERRQRLGEQLDQLHAECIDDA